VKIRTLAQGRSAPADLTKDVACEAYEIAVRRSMRASEPGSASRMRLDCQPQALVHQSTVVRGNSSVTP
jgi:hypothetical protein